MKAFYLFRSILFLVIIFSVFACSSGPGVITDPAQGANLNVRANMTDVIDAATQILISQGFSLLTVNDRLGILTTDYKDVKESFGSSLLLSLFGREDTEVMFTVNIRSSDSGSLLSLIPKGRIQKSSNFKEEYEEVSSFSNKFMVKIESIALEIKELAEQSGSYGYYDDTQIPERELPKTNITNENPKLNTPKNLIEVQEKSNLDILNMLIVKAEKANIRADPTTESPIIVSVGLGTVLDCNKKLGNWFRVIFKDKDGFTKLGFIHESLVKVIEKQNNSF